MRYVMAFVLSLFAATLSAAPVTTPCTGSWDGVGLTACELIGREADAIDVAFNANDYLSGFVVLYEITDYDASNVLGILGDGSLEYIRNTGHPVYGSFAFWYYDTHTIIGIEDLGYNNENSDWDYNDYVVRFDRQPIAVPEPLLITMLGIGLVGIARRITR